jgi:hypothetical protein
MAWPRGLPFSFRLHGVCTGMLPRGQQPRPAGLGPLFGAAPGERSVSWTEAGSAAAWSRLDGGPWSSVAMGMTTRGETAPYEAATAGDAISPPVATCHRASMRASFVGPKSGRSR